MVKLKKIESSAINAIGYNPDSQKLYILFHESGVYRYNNVPVGKFYNQRIKAYPLQYPEKPLLNRQQVQHKSIDQIAKLLDPTQ